MPNPLIGEAGLRTRFQPGKSGNPDGRRKRWIDAERVRSEIESRIRNQFSQEERNPTIERCYARCMKAALQAVEDCR